MKARSKIFENSFKTSKILKRDTDKVMMYYNMPEYLIELNYVPTKIFPSQSESVQSKRFPDMRKIIEYFQNCDGTVPSLILLELESLHQDDHN